LDDSFSKSLPAAKGVVQYNETALVDTIESYTDVASRRPTFEEFSKIMLTLLSTKSPEWSYEEEYRLIGVSSGLQHISKESLRAICFGLRTPQEDRMKIRNVIIEAGYPNCIFTEAIHSKSELFDIEIQPMHC
jgi:hypothetical protein